MLVTATIVAGSSDGAFEHSSPEYCVGNHVQCEVAGTPGRAEGKSCKRAGHECAHVRSYMYDMHKANECDASTKRTAHTHGQRHVTSDVYGASEQRCTRVRNKVCTMTAQRRILHGARVMKFADDTKPFVKFKAGDISNV
jgi:hypothetical protein